VGIANTFNFLNTHPLCRIHKSKAFGNFFRWQLLSKLSFDRQIAFIFPFVEHIKIVARPGETGMTGNLYAGLYEFVDMALVLHFLKDGDLFFDIGSNIGSYALLGSICGSMVVAVEPVSQTYSKLIENISVNSLNQIIFPLKKAVGAEKTLGRVTLKFGAENRVVSETVSAQSKYFAGDTTEEVEIITIDQITAQYGYPVAMKIDIEGYEDQAFAGATKTLENPSVKLLLVETVSPELHQKLENLGFSKIHYNPFTKKVFDTPISKFLKSSNQLYVREIDEIVQRVSQSPGYFICNMGTVI
jgi:FkbM family methyltransferase